MAEDVTEQTIMGEDDVTEQTIGGEEQGLFSSLITELVSSPLNICLLAVCLFLIYKIIRTSNVNTKLPTPAPHLPKLKRQDMTLEQLRKYDGTDEHGRVCIGVNYKVFDVTRGKKFYGPGGPYAAFAGHDATRCFAMFSVKDVKETFDDISDLTSTQMESVREWEMQFVEKYEYVGKLLKPDEAPTEYSEDEDSKEIKTNVDKKQE